MEWSKRYGETTLIELDINNRVGSSLSDDKRPALSLVVPSRGTVNGGTPIVVTGLHLIGHGPLFCQFGEFSKIENCKMRHYTRIVIIVKNYFSFDSFPLINCGSL